MPYLPSAPRFPLESVSWRCQDLQRTLFEPEPIIPSQPSFAFCLANGNTNQCPIAQIRHPSFCADFSYSLPAHPPTPNMCQITQSLPPKEHMSVHLSSLLSGLAVPWSWAAHSLVLAVWGCGASGCCEQHPWALKSHSWAYGCSAMWNQGTAPGGRWSKLLPASMTALCWVWPEPSAVAATTGRVLRKQGPLRSPRVTSNLSPPPPLPYRSTSRAWCSSALWCLSQLLPRSKWAAGIPTQSHFQHLLSMSLHIFLFQRFQIVPSRKPFHETT